VCNSFVLLTSIASVCSEGIKGFHGHMKKLAELTAVLSNTAPSTAP